MAWLNLKELLVVALFATQVLGIVTTSSAQNKDGVDDVVGTRWSYELSKQGESKPFEKGVFRVYKKEVFKGKNKVGVVKPNSPTETTLQIDGLPEINGVAKLKRTDAKPPVWEGTLERKSGKHFKIRVEIRDQ